MKKIFTLLTMALLAIGAQAQTYTLDINKIYDDAKNATGDCANATLNSGTKYLLNAATITQDVFTVVSKSDRSYRIDVIQTNSETSEVVPVEYDSDYTGSYRLEPNGSSNSTGGRQMFLDAPGPGKLYIGAWGNEGRKLVVMAATDKTSYYNVAKATASDFVHAFTADETKPTVTVDDVVTPQIFEININKAGIYCITQDAGIYFGYVKFVQGAVVEAPQFALTKSELYPGEESQIHIEGSEGLEGLIMRNLFYDDEIINIVGDGGIIAKKPGTTTIKFTTDAVEGKYLEGSAELEITVKDYPEMINYPTSMDGVFAEGTTTVTTVKIHANTDVVGCIQLKNGYTADGTVSGNHIKLVKKDGFKAGDVVTIAGVINASDASKRATAVLFAIDEEGKAIKINTFKDFINSYSDSGDPEDQEFVLKESYDVLYLGRDGGTGANLTKIMVVPAPPAEHHDPVAWDFTQALSDDDVANLKADDNWEYDEENGRYSYVPTFTSEEAKANNIVLTANNEALEIFMGLLFGRDGSIDSKKFGIDLGKGLNLAGGKYRVILSDLAKDDEVRVRITGSGEGARSVSLTNVAAGSGLEAPRRAQDANSVTSTDKEVAEGVFTVAADGIVVIETDAALLINAIAINTELPEYTPTGISVINAETEGAADAPVYNLSGQRVDENYRGVVIKNGKKQMQK